MIEKKEYHEREGHDGDDGGDGDELGGFDIITTIFGGEEAERGGGRKGLNEGTDIDYLDWKLQSKQGEVGHKWTNNELDNCDEDEAPFLDESFEISMG